VRATLNIPADVPVVALLPGSRVSELQHMGGLFLDTAREIVNTLPAVRFVAPFVNDKTRTLFSAAQKRANAPDVMLLDGRSHDAIAAADVVLVASGTATLETALLKRPMVIAYKMPRLSYWLLLRHRYQSFVGLPNILAGESVVPELLQDEATPANLAREVIDLFNDSARRQRIAQRFEDLLQTLRQNTAEKAAEAVLPFLDRKRV
jgi:lipid-A-disaccharide synthase